MKHDELSTLFKNLFENKIVYHERFTCITIVENIKITNDLFEATAIPYLLIEKGTRFDKKFPIKPWVFSSKIEILTYEDNWLSTYGGAWNVWCNPEIVEKTECFVLDKKYNDALNLTLYKK